MNLYYLVFTIYLTTLHSINATDNTQKNPTHTSLHTTICPTAFSNQIKTSTLHDLWINELHTCLCDSNSTLFKQILESLPAINLDHCFYKKNNSPRTLLMWAAELNQAECIQALLEYGVSINYQTKDGESAYTIARDSNNTTIINMLQFYASLECNETL